MIDRPAVDAQAVAAAALDLLADGVLVVCDGQVVVANRALRRLVGADLVREPAPAWVPPAPAGGEELEAEAVLPRAGGRRRRVTVVVTARALAGHDGVAQVVTVRDRSAEAAREAELVRRADRDG